MNYRRWSQISEWTLLAIVLLANVFLFFASDFLGKEWGVAGEVLRDATPFAQLVLALSWAVFGPGPPFVRSGIVPIIILGTHEFRKLGWSSGSTAQICSLFDALGALTLLITIAFRFAGQRVAKLNDERIDMGGARFSIRTLFIATTLIAIAIGGLEWLRPRFERPAGEFLESGLPESSGSNMVVLQAEFVRFCLMVAILLGTSISSIWAILRPGTYWLRLLVVGTFGVIAPWYACNLTEAGTGTTLALAVWTLSILSLIVVSILPLRIMNYRLYRPVAQTVKRAPANQHAIASVGRGAQGETHVLETLQ